MLKVVKGFWGKDHRTVVRVAYRNLNDPVPHVSAVNWYSFEWRLKDLPHVGDRVVVPGLDGDAYGVVVGLGSDPDLAGLDVKQVKRLATKAEIKKACQQDGSDQDMWLDMMRQAAGLSVERQKLKLPKGYPSIPPAQLTADPSIATKVAGTWWRAYKSARTAEEAQVFKRIAATWYAFARTIETRLY